MNDFGDLSEGLNFLVNQAQTCKRQVEHDQNHDVETGLLNRKSFIKGVREALQAQPGKFGLLFSCGLDNLKYINETHGYDCGDLYIGKVVDALRMLLGAARSQLRPKAPVAWNGKGFAAVFTAAAG